MPRCTLTGLSHAIGAVDRSKPRRSARRPQVLAELGGVSRRTFYRWRELGQAPEAIKLPNGELRFWRSDFTSWLHGLGEAA